MRPTEKQLFAWGPTVRMLAKKRCRMVSIEQDDLEQEAWVALITAYMQDIEPTEQIIINQMRRYINAVKEGREIVYEPEVHCLVPLWNS